MRNIFVALLLIMVLVLFGAAIAALFHGKFAAAGLFYGGINSAALGLLWVRAEAKKDLMEKKND